MLYWALGICILAFIVACACARAFDSEGLAFLSVVLGVALVVILGFIFCFSADIKCAEVLENKIEMYEEENSEIESAITTLVVTYMDYEQATLESLKSEGSLITLVNLYPELKSDELVQTQIDLYISNQQKIIELKEELIELGKKKVWLGINLDE